VIPLIDLKAQHEPIREEILGAVDRVLRSAQFVLGDETAAFEQEFARFCDGSSFGVAVNSGTSALHLALLAAGVGPGDEVITVPFTFVATVAAIAYTGARPVFVDVNPASLTMDVSQIESAISERTKAVVPVHLYGQTADMDPILETSREHGLVVIEDAAQAHGARYKGKRAGSLGDMGCFSFYPSKNLGACGEGGIVVTGDSGFANQIRLLRDWGQQRKGYHAVKGFNYRMEAIQAAILRVKLKQLPQWTGARRSHALTYDEVLAPLPVQLPQIMPYVDHAFHIYAVRTEARDAVVTNLEQNGIQVGVHYPVPVHLQEAWVDLGYGSGDFPEAEAAAREVLSLPMYPELRRDQIECVAQGLSDACEECSQDVGRSG
jgi:dTDP-4-amino-4,6-dideoxygalactose transaminase